MVGKLKSVDRRLFERCCVQCGISVERGGGGFLQCNECGCDFHHRPPRSYAEMEGLVGHPITLDSPLTPARREARMVQRWLAFLFIVMMAFMLLLFLAGEIAGAM